METDVVRVLRPMAAPGGVRRRHGVLLQLLTRCEGEERVHGGRLQLLRGALSGFHSRRIGLGLLIASLLSPWIVS
jgi:hypothetical protein